MTTNQEFEIGLVFSSWEGLTSAVRKFSVDNPPSDEEYEKFLEVVVFIRGE